MNAPQQSCSRLLTPSGTGAIAVIRVSGPDAPFIVDRFFEPARDRRLLETEPGRLRYGKFSVDGEGIDDVIVSLALRPTSAVDICCHGGIRIVERILQALQEAGAPLSSTDPTDEFWSTGSLIEKEALERLPNAKTERAVRFLTRQRAQLPEALLRAASPPGKEREPVINRLLEQCLQGFDSAKRLVEGVTIAIVGPPNSGKSTLFNRLAGRHAAVVSDLPGTTRDWVSASCDIAGFPVELLDTPGDRAASDVLESLAIATGRQQARRAALRLLVVDGSDSSNQELRPWLKASRTADGSSTILVMNKMDQPQQLSIKELLEENSQPMARLSATTGEGEDALREHIVSFLDRPPGFDAAPCFFTERQAEAARGLLSDGDAGNQDMERLVKNELIGCFLDDTGK
ncbi:MAG: GTP-binding protein [Phycisphaerales bacterium]|nr:MAG: GTP-binding protein [Phycisphaerales bacterium]